MHQFISCSVELVYLSLARGMASKQTTHEAGRLQNVGCVMERGIMRRQSTVSTIWSRECTVDSTSCVVCGTASLPLRSTSGQHVSGQHTWAVTSACHLHCTVCTKLSHYITPTQVNSAFHPSGVGLSHYITPTQANSAFHHSGKLVLPAISGKAKAGMAHSDCGLNMW